MLPNKFIRKALIQALNFYKVYDVDVPIDENIPDKFINIVQIQRQQADIQKDCYSWICNTQIDLYSVNELGHYSTLQVDDMEEYLRQVYYDLDIENFYVENIYNIQTRDNNYDTKTNSINRRIVNVIFKVNSYDTRKSFRD